MKASDNNGEWENVREIIGHLIGGKLLDITQDTSDERSEFGEAYIELHFDSGDTLRITFTMSCGICGFSTYKPDEIEE